MAVVQAPERLLSRILGDQRWRNMWVQQISCSSTSQSLSWTAMHVTVHVQRLPVFENPTLHWLLGSSEKYVVHRTLFVLCSGSWLPPTLSMAVT